MKWGKQTLTYEDVDLIKNLLESELKRIEKMIADLDARQKELTNGTSNPI